MRKNSVFVTSLFTIKLLLLVTYAQSAAAADGRWLGLWQAEGTLFTLRVVEHDDFLHIEPIETLGFIWNNSPGRINGDSAMFNVEYQGVVATVHVQLGEEGTAIARPVSCRPDYHVVCALVQNQQALFKKTSASAP